MKKVEFLKYGAVLCLSLSALQSQAKNADSKRAVPFMNFMKDVNLIDPNASDNNSDVNLGSIDEEGRDAPLFIRNDIAIVYNTPSPSQVKPELIRPMQFIRAARVHEDEGTASFRLYEGHLKNGESQWYILTDTNSRELADHQGLGFSAKLGFADHGRAVRTVSTANDGTFIFEKGRVDFSPVRQIVPGDAPNYFPPKVAHPGSIADADYTPIVKTNGVYYNAPVVAGNVTSAS